MHLLAAFILELACLWGVGVRCWWLRAMAGHWSPPHWALEPWAGLSILCGLRLSCLCPYACTQEEELFRMLSDKYKIPYETAISIGELLAPPSVCRVWPLNVFACNAHARVHADSPVNSHHPHSHTRPHTFPPHPPESLPPRHAPPCTQPRVPSRALPATLYESGSVIPGAKVPPEGPGPGLPPQPGASSLGAKTLTSKAAGLARLFKRGGTSAPSKPPGGDDHPVEAALSGGRRRPSGMGAAMGVDAFAAALAADPSGVRGHAGAPLAC
jgi:hypothetical protein